jgi:hypothetical protein
MSEALVARLRTVASGMGGFNAVTEAADRIEALERELLAAREDARRYRWLRRGDGKAPADGADWPLITMHLTDEAVWDTEADAAIDAAIAAEAPPAK